MSDTQITPELIAYMEKHNLNPANHIASAKNQMRLEEMIMEIAKTIKYDCFDMSWALIWLETLADRWNK